MLNQLSICWRYARRYDRRLVVDGRWSGFLEPLDGYFEPRRSTSGVVMDPSRSPEFESDLRRWDPALVDQRSASVWDPGRSEYLHPESGRDLSFDLTSDHDEAILVHERHGGGAAGIDALERLRLTREVAIDITRRLSALPSRYIGIHVRNTDLRSDHEEFFTRLRGELAHRDVLVASDDLDVRGSATRILTGTRIHWLATTHPPKRQRLHENPDLDRPRVNRDALCDLLALARSDRLLICPLSTSVGGRKNSRESGFSRLARQLHARGRIQRHLLSAAHSRPRASR